MYKKLSNGCFKAQSCHKESGDSVSSRLPDLSSVPDVLPCRCHYHFPRKINSGNGVMGLIMKNMLYISKLVPVVIIFIVVPILLYATGDFPKRHFLMESLSVTTILGFSVLVSQFFLSRVNKKLVKEIRMVKVLKIHKVVGYLFISILLMHPFLIVVPKFFDDGISASDAFLKLITTFGSQGLIMGMIAYTIVLIIMITAFFRFKLNLKYRTWRKLHGFLTLSFLLTATWHVIDIGRHSNEFFVIYYILIAGSAVFFLIRTYLSKPSKKRVYEKAK